MSTLARQPVGFGIIHGFYDFDPDRLVEEARHAEALGFDAFSLADHLHTEHPTLEPWTALTWVAAATQRIELMSNVLGLPYRPPAVTAKMAETLDRLSGGRLVLGLGVGGYDHEFSSFGLAERTPGQKVSALGEAVQIIRGLWNEPAVSYEGQHFQVREARIEPKPAHPIPIWLGAHKPRMQDLVGRKADGWLPSLPVMEPGGLPKGNAIIDDAARAAGRDPREITRLLNIFPDQQTPEALAQMTLEDGVSIFILASDDPDVLERFAGETIPAVREHVARGRK